MIPTVQAFLLGVVATMFMIAAGFFFRYWTETRDSFFLAFTASFLIEGLSRVFVLFLPHPNEGSAAIYLVRLVASLLILIAIVRKNYGK